MLLVKSSDWHFSFIFCTTRLHLAGAIINRLRGLIIGPISCSSRCTVHGAGDTTTLPINQINAEEFFLENIVWISDTFDNIVGIKNDFTKYMKECCWQCSHQHISFKYVCFCLKDKSSKLLGWCWLLWASIALKVACVPYMLGFSVVFNCSRGPRHQPVTGLFSCWTVSTLTLDFLDECCLDLTYFR